MTRSSIDILAPAKLNLYLGVHEGHDETGYHRVDSLMVAIDLYDTVHLEPAEGLSVRSIPSLHIPETRNAAYRAAEAFARAAGRSADVAITIEKRIPYKSGMGGASSDAAAVLLGLARWWGMAAEDPLILEVAQSIGADVAFFLSGKPTLLVGRGDVAKESFNDIPHLPIVLVRPEGDGITAGQAYEDFDRDPIDVPPLEPMLEAMRAKDLDGIRSSMANNLEPVAMRLMPEIGHVHNWLLAQEGVQRIMVTGSGSCTFAICETAVGARIIADAAQSVRGWWGRPTRIMEHGALIAG